MIESRSEQVQGILADLSLQGARILSNGAFTQGMEVLIRWIDQVAFGEVKWSQHNQCGIAFVEPLALDVILRTRAINDASQLPDDRAMLKQIAAQWVQGSRRL